MDQQTGTKFASPQRASEASIRHDYSLIHDFELISKLFSVIPNVVLILNQDRQTVFCNTSLLMSLKEKGIDDVLGKRPGEIINCIHASEEPGGCGTSNFCSVCGAVNAILETKNSLEKCEKECRITVNNEDGIVSLDIKVDTNILELNGQNFITFHITDISDQKRKNILERVFFHDIMNTVGIILNLTELSIETNQDVKLLDYLEKLRMATFRLIEELKNQQELIKAENDELKANMEPISLRDFLSTLKLQYENHLTARNRKIELNNDIPDIIFISDMVLLGRVLGNMIKNALEAIEQNEVVKIDCNTQDSVITFSIHNQTFIPEEVQLQLFQRSFSTKGIDRGIGTYSIKLFTEKHLNGKVSFTSTKNDGTTFFVTIPLLNN